MRSVTVVGCGLLVLGAAACAHEVGRTLGPPGKAASGTPGVASFDQTIDRHASDALAQGREIFRYDTFGDEQFWGDTIKLHEAIGGEKHAVDGVGAGISPKQALGLGLKVDVEKLPDGVVQALKAGKVDLDDVGTTMTLLKADAVVGLKGHFEGEKLTSVGVTCASCHSTVDDSLAPGIGRRLDGWPNRDLNVGAIIAAAPDLQVLTGLLGAPQDKVREVLKSWGPGKYDAELIQDGKAMRPDGKSGATVLPAAFGLAGVNLATYTGWGNVTYWNAYVANTQMHGKGVFFDPRISGKGAAGELHPVSGHEPQFPVGAKAGFDDVRNADDRITSKLASLQYYQLSIPAPKPPESSFDHAAAKRGEALFAGKAQCSGCHVPPLMTEPGWAMHQPAEICIDAFQADRSPDHAYRTTPLHGLFTRSKGGYYHDGRFADLDAVVAHYDECKRLGLAPAEKKDLVEFLKSL